ncbi:breast cancer type 2 susceptibility protein isoform X2 [Scyliorhinus canicula]|uniref:breast cancer type 2 susceptibility protein isoform X2 n=1 Tax=Scyliorhinus canicula TaxID=7830 RepID=UPI0018F5B5C2|nr:breast cancer type 2 susceptibility protein isoform X2 [Scyliorhinus canicula]
MTEQKLGMAMFDFAVLCQEDLGPLCPNWFEELSLSAASNKFNQRRDDAHSFTSSYFKTPWQKKPLYSQLDCTPSIFSGVTLMTPSVFPPEKGNDQTWLKRAGSSNYLSAAQGKVPPYKMRENETLNPISDISLLKSPALFHNTCRTPQHPCSIRDDGCSFFSPPASSEVMSKISESLGAELDPDMSWTSSLATPPSLNPTVIICKAKENDFHQDKPKEAQVPLLLHSNLNVQCHAFAVGLNSTRAMPVIGEEENEELEAVNQSYVPEGDPDGLHNESSEGEKMYISNTVPDEALSSSKSTHLGLRKVKSYTRKRRNNSTVDNFQTLNSIKTLPSTSVDEKDSLESIVAESSCKVVFSNLTPVKECDTKQTFLDKKNSVSQNQSPDAHSCDKNSEKELSGHNITSSSDWSQLNLSELDENQMINGYCDIVDSPANALCLKNVGDLTLGSNENTNNQQQHDVSEEDIDKESSSVSWKEISPIAQRSTSYCSISNDFSTVNESTKNSGAKVKVSTPNHTCNTTQLSKPPTPEILYTDCFTNCDSTSIQPPVEGSMDSDSETAAKKLLLFCKDERAQMKKRSDFKHKTHLIKQVTTLENQKVTFTDSASNDNMPIQPAVSSRKSNDGVYCVTDPETVKSTSLVLDSVKCRVNEEDHTFMLSSLKGRTRKFLYSVREPTNHQVQDTSLDATELQNRTSVLPLALKPSCKSPEKSGMQLSVSATCKENEEATSSEFVPDNICDEANETHNTEANESLQHHRQLHKNSDRAESGVVPQHFQNETVNLSNASHIGKNWDSFVTPLNSRPVSWNKRERKIFAMASHTVAKRLTMESKVMLPGRFGVQAEGAEDSCVLAVVNSVQPEKKCVTENTVTPNKARINFEFSPSPLSDANRSLPHHDCSSANVKEDPIVHDNLNSNDIFIPISAQLSTKQLSCTSIKVHTVSSHSSCIANVLHKTKKLLYDRKNCERTLKIKAGLYELKSKENNEISTSLGEEKHFEGSLAVDEELSNEDQRLDLCTPSEAENREYSVNTDFEVGNKKIAVLASTLKSRKPIAEDDNGAFLTTSDPVLVQSLPECETKYTESNFAGAKEIPCDIPCSTISDLELTLNKPSKLTEELMNSHEETRTTQSVTETKLHEFAEVTQHSQCIVTMQEKNTNKLELKSSVEADISLVTIKEICTVSENAKNPLISGHAEPCKPRPKYSNFKSIENPIDLSAEIISDGKLFKKFENESSEVNSAEDAFVECITSKNRFGSLESPTIASAETEIKLLEKCLTVGQIELTELFSTLEDTDSQFKCMQFRNQSAVDLTNKNTDLLIMGHLGHTPPAPILDRCKDTDFGKSLAIEPSKLLSSELCNLQKQAEFSNTETRFESFQQNTEVIEQTISYNHANSCVGLSNKEKEISSTVLNFHTASVEPALDTFKMKRVTVLDQAIPPLKDKVSFKGEYGGFCAASGNKIKLSAESLRKAADVFKDIDNDQTSAQKHTIKGLGYLLESSVTESENVTEDKQNDIQKTVKPNESYQLSATLGNHFTVNTKNNEDNILKSENKLENSNRKISGFQSGGSRRIIAPEEATLDKTIYLTTEQNVLQNSDTKKKEKSGTIKSTIWEKNTWQPGCYGRKDDGNNKLVDSKMKPADDYLLHTTSAGPFKLVEASAIEGSDEITCFQTASGKSTTVSKRNLDKVKRLLDTEDCWSENWQNSKLPTGIAKNAPQQRDNMNMFQSPVKKINAIMQLSDQTGSSQTGLNVLACPAFIVHSENNISEDTNSIQNSLLAAPGTVMKGFQTASGKMVPVCKSSLDKAKALFAEEDLLNKTLKHSVETFSTVTPCPQTGSPFIQNANKDVVKKQLENDHNPEILYSLNLKSHSNLHDFSVQTEHMSEYLDLGNGAEMKGFQTASGRKVSVSKVALDKGRALFVEEDYNTFRIQDNLISTAKIKNVHSEGSVLNDREVTLPQRLDMRNQMTSLPAEQSLGFCNENGNTLSVSDTNLKLAKEKCLADGPCESKSSDSNTVNVDQAEFAGDVFEFSQQLLKSGPIAFKTANGKSVRVSEESLKKCKHFFNEAGVNEKFETMDKDLKYKETGLSKETWHPDLSSAKTSLGFNTASGKAVLVSDGALQRVKHMLKEFDVTDGSLSSPKCSNSIFCEKSQQLLLTSTCSPSLFCNTAMSSEQACEEENSELIHKVSNDGTESTLIKQNSARIDSNGREMNRPARNLAASSNKSVFMSGFQTAKGKEVMVEESSLTAARMQLASVENDKLDYTTESVKMHTESRIKLTCNINSVPTSIVHALKSNHGIYPKMLENEVEKEAVEGSKALMEDDEPFDMTPGKAFRPTYDGTHQSIRPDLRTGKRLRSEGNAAREPRPKRQLLSEFNRTKHTDHNVAFKPVICNPEGVLRDRRKFMYHVPLKPVTCGPPEDKSISNRIQQQSSSPNITFSVQENSIQHNVCLQHEATSLKGQAIVFKPPFQRHAGDSIQQNSSRQSTSKPANVFVPPFKTVPSSTRMETLENMKMSSPIQTEFGISMKSINCSKQLQDDGALEGDPVVVGCVDDKLQSMSDTSEKLQANSEGLSRLVQNWSCARDLQEMRLIKKRRQTIHPLPGSLYRTKTSGAPRISLHSAVEGKVPTSFTEEQLYVYGVSRSTLGVQAANAESFQINSREFLSEELFETGSGVQLADGGWLIPDNNGMAGKSEFYRALLDSPGVDPKLISEVWAYNHYKWLVWKFAAMEASFPKEFGSRCLTPETILLHLKYRYDIEIDQCHRSALKKIMERDDAAAKTLVVCVSQIISMGTESFQNSPNLDGAVKQSKTVTDKSVIETKKDTPCGIIEVTDGWYGIKALLDLPLISLLREKKLVVGQKIIIHGAELIGSQDACTPLEAPESLMIKISANSTRPARWYAKLGFHRDPRPFQLPISTLFSEGGMVGCVDVIVVRIYPMQWMEKKSKGMYVFRNERAEEREAQIHYENQQRKLETLYAKIETRLQEQFRVDRKKKREHKIQKLSDQQIMMLQDGVDLYEAIQNSSDPISVEACLNEQQLRALNNYRQLLKEQKQIQIEAEFRKALEDDQSENSYTKRDVASVWKLRVVDYKSQDCNAVYMLNVWRPIAELHSLLKEGGRYWIYYLTTSSCKSRLSRAELQLTATKKTRYQQLQPSLKVLEQLYQPRQAVTYSMLLDPSFGTVCREVDLAGYVIHILGKSGPPTTLYLADENQNLVAVKVWTGLNQLALEDIVKPGILIVASNLQCTLDSCMGIPILFTGDLSSLSANPKEGHLREKYTQLKNSVQNLQNFIKDTKEKVMTMLETINTPRSSRDFSADLLAPSQRKSNSVPVNSTELTSSSVESKPQILSAAGSRPSLCSTKITSDDFLTNLKKKKLSFLTRIPSPVPLTPLCNSVSPTVQKGFRPPRRCVTPQSCEKVIQTGSNKPTQAPSLKRTEISKIAEDNWVTDEELAMINTQALREGWANGHNESGKGKVTKEQMITSKDITLLSEHIKNHPEVDLGSQISKIGEDNWVTDEELAMINTQALFERCANENIDKDKGKVQKSLITNTTDLVFLPQNASYLDSELGRKVSKIAEDNWVADEELAMINTQVLCEGWVNGSSENVRVEKAQVVSSNDTTSLQQNVKMYLDCKLETVVTSPDKSPPVVPQSKRRRKNETSVVNSSEETCLSERTVTAQNIDGDKADVQDENNLDSKQILFRKLSKNRK